MSHEPSESPIKDTRRWRVEEMDFSRIDLNCLRERDDLFLLVCCASFIESGADIYTRNLIDFFADDQELATWLRQQWETEELQHGKALKAYVKQAWPEFDWESAYADFFAEYGPLCVAEELEPTRGQELVARCIVEMGTTTFYQALHDVSGEPLLRELTWLIRTDEVRHYKNFYHHFLKYRVQEGLHRGQVMASLWRRMRELRESDADIAFRHAVAWRYKGETPPASPDALKSQVFGLAHKSFPIDLATRMALKPLQLNSRWQRWLESPASKLARWVMLS